MANITVSSDVDTMLQSADNAEILSNIGASSSLTQVATNTANIAAKQDTLTFGIADTNAVKIDNTNSPANSGDICKFAGSGIMPYKYANLKYDLGVDLKAPIANPTFTGSVETPQLKTREIQCEGTTSGTAQPIKYDAREHRFRDFNETPSDLMVIKMIAGEGGRVGINEDNPKCALHVIQKGSSGYPDNEAIRCTGGLRISNWLRLGPYTDSERDAIGLDPPQGLMIYNEEHDEVQVFIANPSGSGRGSWKAFTLQDVAT